MRVYIFLALGALAYTFIGWWALLVVCGLVLLDFAFTVARAFYLGMKTVVDYHGGWRGVWRYIRS